MLISEFIRAFDAVLPLTLAMADDPVGVQVMPSDDELTGVVVCYELDDVTIRGTAMRGANLAVVFHPLMYPSVSRITPGDRVGRAIMALIEARMTALIVHTAFDAHPRGTSRLLAERIGLRSIQPLVPDARMDGAGMGAIGDLGAPASLESLARTVKDVCGASAVRTSGGASEIRRVAVLGGSGMSFYDSAVAAGAEAFVTADVRYHGFHAANDRIPVIDPGHAESERFVPDGIASLVSETLGTLGVAVPSRALPVSTNPVRYFVI